MYECNKKSLWSCDLRPPDVIMNSNRFAGMCFTGQHPAC